MSSTAEAAGAEISAAVEAMFARLDLPEGASMKTIIDRAERIYGKPIVLQAVSDDRLKKLTGLFCDTPQRGYVSFRLADPLIYQLQCICHEIGHAVFKHEDCVMLRDAGFDLTDGGALGESVIKARGRGLVRDASELVAEEFAYMLVRWLLRSSFAPEEGVFG